MDKVDYGTDAPKVIRNLMVIGLLLLVISNLPSLFRNVHESDTLRWTTIVFAFTLIGEGGLMLLYSKKGKYKQRERILDQHNWAGNETVLDIGTGNGLLMIGAAKRLTSGRSIGIDIWRGKDLTDNTVDKAMNNANLEGVNDKIEILKENIISTSFPDNHFDVIVSNLCLHNISESHDRQKACREIYRILKPGGTAIISDFKNNKEYRNEFSKAGMKCQKAGTYIFDTFPPLTITKAVKA